MKFVTIIGARPQFIKAAPLSAALREKHEEVLVHTGQHYDANMSDVFFDELGIPKPQYNLGIGGGTHGEQTGRMLEAVEKVFLEEKPDAAIIYGDTNSTVAGALAAAKLHIPVAHVEAGLRSFNRDMPEEINRIVADHLATWCFCPSRVSVEQLAREGVVKNVLDVGDIMADAVRLFAPRAAERSQILEGTGIRKGEFALATIHRPVNTDDPKALATIFAAFERLPVPVVLPLHPRTRGALSRFGLLGKVTSSKNVKVIPPLGYFDMLQLQHNAAFILTDSGGVQKEAYYAGTPCLTLRNETEWVETVEAGWNRLLPIDEGQIVRAASAVSRPADRPNLYGDGRAAERIVCSLSARTDSNELNEK